MKAVLDDTRGIWKWFGFAVALFAAVALGYLCRQAREPAACEEQIGW